MSDDTTLPRTGEGQEARQAHGVTIRPRTEVEAAEDALQRRVGGHMAERRRHMGLTQATDVDTPALAEEARRPGACRPLWIVTFLVLGWCSKRPRPRGHRRNGETDGYP